MDSWRKSVLFIFLVILPGVLVGMSNFDVFPKSFVKATILLLITVGVVTVITWRSRQATLKTQRSCIFLDVVVSVLLCVNVGSHWILARQVEIASANMARKHEEEDRLDERQRKQAQLKLAEDRAQSELLKNQSELLKNQTAQLNAENKRLSLLPPQMRRSVLGAPRPSADATPDAFQLPVVDMAPVKVITRDGDKKIETPEEVMERFMPFLTFFAYLEAFVSIVGGALVKASWEWDRDGDGKPDAPGKP
jgi:hypothetical protein